MDLFEPAKIEDPDQNKVDLFIFFLHQTAKLLKNNQNLIKL